jgi:hypothetical protein
LGNTTGNQGENPLTIKVAAPSGLGAYAMRVATITVTLGALNAQLKVCQGFGTVISSLRWADCNVGEPEQFAASPDDQGLLYQYNSKIGYPHLPTGKPAGYETGYTDNGVNTWTDEESPCPAGWRIPTKDEIDALIGNNGNTGFFQYAYHVTNADSATNKISGNAGFVEQHCANKRKGITVGGVNSFFEMLFSL